MIIACPVCGTRYQVAEAALARPSGRAVRCANCGHSWHYAGREPPAPPEPAPAPRPSPRAVPAPQPRRAGAALLVAAIAVLIVAGAILAGLAYQQRVVARWPAAARLYAFAGIAGPAPGVGLEIRQVVPSRTAGGLVIAGEIANTIGHPLTVPRLRIALRDGKGKELKEMLADPPKRQLGPGQTERFKAVFADPGTATGVVVTFAPT